MTGRELKAIRRRLRFTQDAMAKRLKIDRRTLGRYERGQAPIPIIVEYAVRWLDHVFA